MWWVVVPEPSADALTTAGRFLTAADYATDADPALLAAMTGHVFNMYGVDPGPLMMPLALLIRLPAVLIAQLLGIVDTSLGFEGQTQRYLAGVIGALAICSAAIGLSQLPGSWQRRDLIASLLLIMAVICNPISVLAVSWGHVEEVVMASFLLCAFLSILRGRYRWAAVAAACAVATKQPALFALPALFLAIPTEQRWQTLRWFMGAAALLVVPFVAGNMVEFFSRNVLTVGNAAQAEHDHAYDLFTALSLPSLAILSRPLIAAVAVLLPVLIWWRCRTGALEPTTLALTLAAVMLSRCLLDPFNIHYYATPAVLILGGLDITLWEKGRHPAQRLPYLRRLPLSLPLPVFLFASAWYLETVTGGAVSQFASHYLAGQFTPIYVLATAPLIGALSALALGWRPEMTRARLRLYGLLIAGVAVVFAAAAATYQPSTKRVQVPAPGGFTNAKPEEIASVLAPKSVYWLGGKDLDADNFLRMSVHATSLKRNRQLPARAVAAIFDYGTNEGFESVSVLTHTSVDPNARREIIRCQREPRSCARGWRVIDSPIGPGIVDQTWHVKILAGDQIVDVIDISTGYKPEEILRLLRPVESRKPGNQ